MNTTELHNFESYFSNYFINKFITKSSSTTFLNENDSNVSNSILVSIHPNIYDQVRNRIKEWLIQILSYCEITTDHVRRMRINKRSVIYSINLFKEVSERPNEYYSDIDIKKLGEDCIDNVEEDEDYDDDDDDDEIEEEEDEMSESGSDSGSESDIEDENEFSDVNIEETYITGDELNYYKLDNFYKAINCSLPFSIEALRLLYGYLHKEITNSFNGFQTTFGVPFKILNDNLINTKQLENDITNNDLNQKSFNKILHDQNSQMNEVLLSLQVSYKYNIKLNLSYFFSYIY
jgi:hypothetical protein